MKTLFTVLFTVILVACVDPNRERLSLEIARVGTAVRVAHEENAARYVDAADRARATVATLAAYIDAMRVETEQWSERSECLYRMSAALWKAASELDRGRPVRDTARRLLQALETELPGLGTLPRPDLGALAEFAK